MNDELAAGLAKLREPFPSEAIGKLPKVTCKACVDRNCKDHTRKKCSECEAFMTPAHIHIDFVGHAQVTDRLLSVDPEWTWEPMAWAPDGLPALVRNERGTPVGMWIRLTVLGVTRPGYGSCEQNKIEVVKELIGDALRNAAMRFGVALDMWSKGELESVLEEPGEEKPKLNGGDTLKKARDAVERAKPARPPLPGRNGHTPPVGVDPSTGEVAERSGEGGPTAPAETSGAAPADPDRMSAQQNRMIHALLNGLSVTDEDEQRKLIGLLIGRDLDSKGTLTKAEASTTIEGLKERQKQIAAAGSGS